MFTVTILLSPHFISSCVSYLEDKEVVCVTVTKHKLRPNICVHQESLYGGHFELLATETQNLQAYKYK